MNTKHKFNKVLANILSMVAILAIAFPASGSASAQEPTVPNPTFVAYVPGAIEGYDWPLGQTVSIDINDGQFTDEAVAEESPWDPAQTRVLFEVWKDGITIEAGDHIVMTDGIISKDVTVTNLAVTDMDVAAGTVSGIYDPDYSLWVWLYDGEGQVPETDSENGTWVATFTELPLGALGGATQWELDGDGTSTDFQVPKPRFTVYPEWEAVEAWDWPDGATVAASVGGKSECYIEGMSGYPEWYLSTTNVWMNFPEGCDVAQGDEVTLSVAGVPDISHTVRNLSVTNVSAEDDTVTGMADSGVTVYVWPHGFGEYELQPTAGGDGSWLADFSGFGDDVLQPGMDGRAEVRDDYGNSTAVDWHAPKPRFTVYPIWEAVEAWDWPAGVQVTASVTGNEDNCTTDGYPIADPWGTNVWMNFPEDCDVVAGNEVILGAEGVTPISHTVRNLSVTNVSAEDDTVTGMADSGVTVYVWPHGFGEYEVQPTTGDGTTWVADFFSEFGDVLQPGMDGRAEVRDDYGNSTAVDWHAPKPRFTVYPEWEAVEAWDWPDGITVTATIDENDCAVDKVAGYPDWDPSTTNVWMNFPEGCDMTTSDVVTLRAEGVADVSHTVQNLSVTKVEPGNDVVKGTADAGTEVYVWPHATGEQQSVSANPKGKWNVYFNGIFDLNPGDGGRAEVRDEFGNATAVDWYIPNPRIVASITEDWFFLQEFSPNTTLAFTVFKAQDEKAIWRGTATTDDSGFAWIDSENRWDLIPGVYLVVKDGQNTKDLVIEGFTFDVFDASHGILQGTVPGQEGRHVWAGIGFENDGWSMDVNTDGTGSWFADFGQPVPSEHQWVAAQIFDEDGDASELRPSSQIIYLRPSCGTTYTVQANALLEIGYGGWLAIGEDLAEENALHLTVDLVIDGELVTGDQQPVVPGSEIPCFTPPEDAYGVFYITHVQPLEAGEHSVFVTWILDDRVIDGYDADGNGELDWYGPGEVATQEFTIIVP